MAGGGSSEFRELREQVQLLDVLVKGLEIVARGHDLELEALTRAVKALEAGKAGRSPARVAPARSAKAKSKSKRKPKAK